jgi:S-formylglutathione hydrolase FrmB
MWRTLWIAAVLLPPLAAPPTGAQPLIHNPRRAARRLAGTLVDYTHRHGADRRFWSPILGERRDLYVYLPPGFDPHQSYPVLIWLHGIDEDERTFVGDGLLLLDAAMACGRLPPMIVAIPNGNIAGRGKLFGSRPLWFNSNLGPYEDYVVGDVWGFVRAHYQIRPERQAHVLGGFSSGGAAAYRIAIRYREQFGAAFSVSGPLNIRWVDCHGRYLGNFDPCCWGWRTDVNRGREPIGRFWGGVITVRLRQFVYPLFGRSSESLKDLIVNNPIEMVELYAVQPGELALFAAYGGRDEFNLDAQNESFLYRARQRGLCVDVACDPRGRHRLVDAQKFFPQIIHWLSPLMAPYGPPFGGSCAGDGGGTHSDLQVASPSRGIGEKASRLPSLPSTSTPGRQLASTPQS